MKQEKTDAILESIMNTLDSYQIYRALGGVAIPRTSDDALRSTLDAIAEAP